MLLIGQYDEARLGTVADYARTTSGSKLALVPGAAHGIFSDRPFETEAILRAWFRRHD